MRTISGNRLNGVIIDAGIFLLLFSAMEVLRILLQSRNNLAVTLLIVAWTLSMDTLVCKNT